MIDNIDSLLGILHNQKGKELRLEVGQRPRLITDTGVHDLAATPLGHPQVGSLIAPIVPEETRRELQTQSAAEFDYELGGVGNFRVRIIKAPTGLAVSVRPASERAIKPTSPAINVPSDLQSRPPAQSGGTGALSSAPAAPPTRQTAPIATPSSGNTSQMDRLFRDMVAKGASDLHMSASMPPMIRKDGVMIPLDESLPRLAPDELRVLLTSIMPQKNRDEFDRRHDTDFAYEIAGLARFRANIFMDRKGWGGVFRVIPNEILTAEKLNLSQAILKLCHLNKGLVLVTGPTGSGKSTTLCALIDYINRTRTDHIVTIEDPIEFVHENKKCLINQREVHTHTDSFKDALRAALREDPDIVLVGEMRDLETVAIAIETAETGHLVFGTLHTTTAASTVDRVIDQFPADRQMQIRIMLSESLRAVISQTLLRKVGGGRVAALEVLIINNAISNLIREGKTFQIPSAMQTGRALGNIMLNDALIELVKAKTVTAEEAYAKAVDKTGFEGLLKRNNIDAKLVLTPA
ncbi:MAG: PilT/PilU family type 4a pilus ATPase [Acidobacteriota bacterium]